MLDYASIRLNFPNITDKGVSDYYGKGIELEEIKSSMGPQFGSGTPEGNITSNLSRLYVDTDTNTMYANPDFGVNTGWIAV
ncbi:MAG: hypothetical protein ACYSOJ_05190 [Planctomycetota bacterium]